MANILIKILNLIKIWDFYTSIHILHLFSNLPAIIKPTSYNFSFKGKNNLKEIYNQWDIFIDWSLNQGNSHYSFTINYPVDEIQKLSYCLNSYKNILKLHPLDKNESFYFGKHNDKYENFELLENSFISSDTWFYDVLNFLYENKGLIKTQSWIFIIIEENENGITHIHGTIAIKNLMDYNKNIINNITKEFKKKYSFVDIVMKNLNTFIDIKEWIRYLHQNNQWVFKPCFRCLKKDMQLFNDRFLKCYISNYNMHNTNQEDLKFYKDTKEYNGLCIGIGWFSIIFGENNFLDNTLLNKYGISEHFIGIRLNKNELSEDLMIDLVGNYIYINNLYINNNNVYKKIQDTCISYEKLGTIGELFFEGFQNTIIPFYTNNFLIQFEGFDFYYIIKNFKLKMENHILKIKSISNNKIDFNFNVMEFTDGIYDLRNNLFIKKNKLNLVNHKIKTIKYYNKTYDWISRNKPNSWINGVKNALGNNKDFIILCLFIANLFQPTNENLKKNFLFIYGPSNTGKTTYSSKVLTRYFGSENIGSIITDSNFKFQDIDEKLFVILEEFKYRKNSASDFLKLLGGEKLLTSKKYSKEHITIENLKGLIVSNNEIDEKNREIKNALVNRLFIINFLKKNLYTNNKINESLIEEEPNIIVFCNKLYFNYFNKKQKRYRLLSREYNAPLVNKNKFNMSLMKFVFTGVLGKITNLQEHPQFKMKYLSHTNSLFNVYESKNGISVEQDGMVALTNTKDPKLGWEIGQLPDGEIQYMNKDFIGKFNKETFEVLKSNQSYKVSDIEKVEGIKNVIKNNSTNLEKVTDDLSIMFEKSKVSGKLWECMQIKSINGKCMEYYKIVYGNQWIEIIQQVVDITTNK